MEINTTKIPTKIAWYLDATQEENVTRYCLGKRKYSKSKQALELIKEEKGRITTKLLDKESLLEFTKLYEKYIGEKSNAKVHDIYSKYESRITDKNCYIACIHASDGTLLAGGIFIHKTIRSNQTLMLGFRAIDSSSNILGLKFGILVEYLFFELGKELKVTHYSRGKDRNGYGIFGSNIGLAIHKVEMKFLPYVSKETGCLEITNETLTQEGLFFYTEVGGVYTKVLLVKSKVNDKWQNREKLLRKRGFEITIIELET